MIEMDEGESVPSQPIARFAIDSSDFERNWIRNTPAPGRIGVLRHACDFPPCHDRDSATSPRFPGSSAFRSLIITHRRWSLRNIL